MKWGRGERGEVKILCYSFFARSTKKSLVKDENCPNGIFKAEEIEKAVIGVVMKFAAEYGEERERNPLSSDEIVEGLKIKKEKLEREYSRLIVAYRKIGDDNVLEQAAETKKKIKKIEKDIADEEEKKVVSLREKRKSEIIRTLPGVWDKMTDGAKKRVVRGLVEKVIVKKDGVDVHLNPSAYDRVSDEIEE